MTEEEFFQRYSFNVREDKIGGGSFGTVYRAYDNVLDREVAIKVSEVRIAGDKEFSLREEFKAIEKLPPHANIANYEEVHTFESFNGVFDYAIMQYYPLGNLDHFLFKNKLSQEKKEELVLAILDGIAHLHKHHIVQRDLKPSNILVVDRKGKLIPKITDFGLSKQANADSKASRFTNSFAGGTLQYCSPEQIKGLPLKLNTDLWSFGAIAYEIFTGNALFQVEGSTSASAEWQNEVSKKILHEDYSAKLDELTGNWPEVVAACLERDMNQRVKDAEELLKILKGETTTEDTAATQISPQADNNATQIFNRETVKEKREEKKTESETKKAPTKNSPKENKNKKQDIESTLPKLQSSRKKVWIGIAAGLVTAVAVGYGFTYLNTSDSANHASGEIVEGPVVFKKDSLFGYKSDGKVVIQPSFLMADGFLEGKARVSTKDSTFYIDSKGDWAASYTEEIEEEAIADNNTNKKEEKKAGGKSSDNEKLPKKLNLAEQKTIYDEGESLYDKKHYKKAYEKYIQIAKFGYAEAEFKIGKMYDYGYYLNKNDSKAYEWYLKAGEHGDNRGYGNIGYNYFKDKDYVKALEWLLKAANDGNAVSMNNIGAIYITGGHGVEKNVKKGIKWYLKAAEKGNTTAMENLGNLYENGDKVSKDLKKAVQWYKKAADNGNEDGAYNLGKIYWKGDGVPEDNKLALEWFKKAAAKGHTDAMAYAGHVLEYAKDLGYDWEESRKWYEKAANNGNRWGKRELGEFYLFGVGGVSKDENKAKGLFREAANAGDEKAKTYLQVISDIENNKYYQLNESKKGNKLYLKEGERDVESLPFVFSDYTKSWAVTFQYELGESTTGVQIWPYKVKSDGVNYAQYWPCNVLKDNQGAHKTGIAWAGHDTKYNDGGREIGYIYVYGKFYGSQEELKIKMPVMLCWKPKHYYE